MRLGKFMRNCEYANTENNLPITTGLQLTYRQLSYSYLPFILTDDKKIVPLMSLLIYFGKLGLLVSGNAPGLRSRFLSSSTLS